MAPGDVCHGPRCSLAGLGPVALEYRSCHWPDGSAGSPQCVRPMGYWFFPVPRLPYVCAASWAVGLLFTGVPARFAVVRLRCPGPAGSCSPVCPLGVLCCMCGVLGPWAPVYPCACCVRCACAMGGCVPLPPPLMFVFFFFLFFFFLFFFFFRKKKKKKQKRGKQRRAYTAGTGMGSWCGGAIAHMGPKTKSAHLLRWHYGERVTMGQFSNSCPKHFSYLCEYAFRFDLSCSFCEYSFIFHCLHCSPSCFDPDPLLFAYYWLGLSWIDCI